jgi:hypothetical protein
MEKDDKPIGPIIHQNGQPVNSLKTAWKLAKEKAGVTRRLRIYDLSGIFSLQQPLKADRIIKHCPKFGIVALQ